MTSIKEVLWHKLDSFPDRQKDVGKDSLSKRGTVSGKLLDHTANALEIQENGNKPDDWLNYTRFIRQSVDFPDPVNKHNFLCGIYDLAIKTMSVAENKKNVAYAILLIEYANLKSEYSPDDAQALFNYARVHLKRLAVVYIADAQFKLKQGYPGKCKKIFEKALMFDAQPNSLLKKAMKNFTEGKSVLLSEEEMGMYIKNEIDMANKDKRGSTGSKDSTGTGDWGFSGHSDRHTLPVLSNKPAFQNNDPVVEDSGEADPMEANTAPIDMETDRKIAQEPPAAPASCSKPPFRSYHSTPDIKGIKCGAKQNTLPRRSNPKFMPRRVKKLEIPVDMTVDEESEEDVSFSDIKPLHEDQINQDHNKTQASESMNQSHPGHTSGYVSSMSMTCHTKTCPIPPACVEEKMESVGPGEGVKQLCTPGFPKMRPSPVPEEKPVHVAQDNASQLPPMQPNSGVAKPCPVPVMPVKHYKSPDTIPMSLAEPLNTPAGSVPSQGSRPQPQIHPNKHVVQSRPVFATPSHHGVRVITQQATPMMVQSTPNMKTVEELWVNGKSYQIFKVVGRGGSSKVYHCLDYENERNVGIKRVDLTDADETIIQGYKNEITLLKRLQYSDKVIKMCDYEHNEEKNCLLIVMELGDTDLASLFRNASKSKDITPSLMNYYWEAMLKAVKVLHAEGIVHSDLKPANFLLVKGQLKLIDFGIANAIQQDRTSVMRDSQVGTLNYMSPEAICGGMSTDSSGRAQPRYKIGVKSDVWSLGCILYNMVYGRTPFQRITNPIMKCQAIINSSYHIEFKDITDKALLDVMKRCLIRDVKLRPSIDDLLAHPYLKKTKEPCAVPETLLAKIQAMANSPNSVRQLENVLEQLKGGKVPDGSGFT